MRRFSLFPGKEFFFFWSFFLLLFHSTPLHCNPPPLSHYLSSCLAIFFCIYLFLAPMRSSRCTSVEWVSERVTDLCFYIRELNILVPSPSVSQTFSSQDSLAQTLMVTRLSRADSYGHKTLSRRLLRLCNCYYFVIFRIFRAIRRLLARHKPSTFLATGSEELSWLSVCSPKWRLMTSEAKNMLDFSTLRKERSQACSWLLMS